MPWQVIVWNNRPKAGEPCIAAHEAFRDADYPDEMALLQTVGVSEERLRVKYPAPDFTVVSGSGPGPENQEAFGFFLAYLLRDD